jgi:hypothetical protein
LGTSSDNQPHPLWRPLLHPLSRHHQLQAIAAQIQPGEHAAVDEIKHQGAALEAQDARRDPYHQATGFHGRLHCGEPLRVPGEVCSVLGWDGLGQAIRQIQAAIHLLPEQLTPLGADGEGAVMQISAEVAQGITDAAPVIGAEVRGQGHQLKTFGTQLG